MLWTVVQILGIYFVGGILLSLCIFIAFACLESADSWLQKLQATRADREVEMLDAIYDREAYQR